MFITVKLWRQIMWSKPFSMRLKLSYLSKSYVREFRKLGLSWANYITGEVLNKITDSKCNPPNGDNIYYSGFTVTSSTCLKTLLPDHRKYWKLSPADVFLFFDFSGTVHELITHSCDGEWPNERHPSLQHNIKHCSSPHFLYIAEIQSPMKYPLVTKADTKGRCMSQYRKNVKKWVLKCLKFNMTMESGKVTLTVMLLK